MPKKFSLFSILLLQLNNFSPAQQIEKVRFDDNDAVYGYYLTIKPASPTIQGVIILLDGYGGNADGFLAETKIPNVAYANEILTVCVPTGTRLYADDSMIALLNRISKDIVNTYHLKKDQFAIGGMSSGGTIAVRYAELCWEKPAEFPILPKAVFDVDSPVDLLGLYESSTKELEKNYPGFWLDESRMIIERFKSQLGDPINDVQKYNEASPFYTAGKEPGNEKYLKNVAFRTYHDVDVNWYIQNRRRSLYQTNMLNASELVNRLVLQGNNNAEFIGSKITGRRSNGQRHPHSWNIVDEIDIVQWIREKLNFYPDHIDKPYTYSAPNNWSKEILVFPLDFAPAIQYHGFEELRFAPGWGDSTSYQKWGYTLLWWLNDSTTITEEGLKTDLESYYTGLSRRRAIADKQDTTAFRPAQALVQKTTTLKGELETYYATLFFYDAQVTRRPGELYFKINVKECVDKTKTMLFIEVAENSYTAPIWLELDKINREFKCP
jgi:hypothetical protein